MKVCAYLVAGAKVDKNFIKSELAKKNESDKIVCVDAGLNILDELKIEPDFILGDFDSVDKNILEKYDDKKIFRYKAEKDFSDTELAIKILINLRYKRIYILAGLGARMDHSLSNIYLLAKYKKLGIDIFLLDEYNKIYVKDKSFSLSKNEQYGKYISFYPLENIKDFEISLEGFKYSLSKANINLFNTPSLYLSNEIIKDKVFVKTNDNMLLCIESKD